MLHFLCYFIHLRNWIPISLVITRVPTSDCRTLLTVTLLLLLLGRIFSKS